LIDDICFSPARLLNGEYAQLANQTINLCEAKFAKENFAITKAYAAQLRIKKSIFRQATKTKKATFNTLVTTYPALKNQYYLAEIDNEITMDKLFEPA
jgi:uncharacterized protein